MRDYYSNLETFYNQNHKKLINPNFIWRDDKLTWNNRLGWLKEHNYEKYFQWLINEKQYSLLLTDGAALQIYYEFYKDALKIASLSFYPVPESGFEPFRFDLDIDAAKDYHHTHYHIHYGYNTKGMRMPLYRFPMPSEYIKFVLAYVYAENSFYNFKKDLFLDNLDDLECKYNHSLKFNF
jgi:hypothetical protein